MQHPLITASYIIDWSKHTKPSAKYLGRTGINGSQSYLCCAKISMFV